MPPRVVVAQLGARMHYAVPAVLHRAGLLDHCYTDAYVGPGSPWAFLRRTAGRLPAAWQPPSLRRLLDRQARGLPPDKVTAFNLFGLRYSLALARTDSVAARQRLFLRYGDRFGELILRHLPRAPQAVYVFQGSAFPLLDSLPARKIYERFSAPQSLEGQLLEEERERWPDWGAPAPEPAALQPVLERERQEWARADLILCPSEFVLQGLLAAGVPAGKLRLLPYGVDLAMFSCPRRDRNPGRPVRLLFVGRLGRSKGVPYLWEALKLLAKVPLEARLVGPLAIPEPVRSRLAALAQLTGQVPRSQVLRHYAWADVFVFPAICEGSATVCYEALAAGLPVITTPHAGSVVRDGKEGFLVPIRDPEALADRVARLAADPDLRLWMSANARSRAREFSWEAYGERLVAALQ